MFTASSITGHTPPPPPAPHFAFLPGVEGMCRRALETRSEQDGWDGKEEQREVLTAEEGGEQEQSWADPKFLDSQRMATSIRTMAARAEGARDRD